MNDKGMWGAEEAQWQQTAQGVDKNFGKIKGNLGPSQPQPHPQAQHSRAMRPQEKNVGVAWGWAVEVGIAFLWI